MTVRNIRRKAMEELARIKKDGEAGEDEVGRAEKDLDKTTADLHRPDRRPGQAQRRRAAGGLGRRRPTFSNCRWQTPTRLPPTGQTHPRGARRRRAGRAQPARRHRASARSSGFGVIAILVFAPLGWVPVVAVAMAVATHEVVRRLRDGGIRDPDRPAARRRPGHGLADVAVRRGRRARRVRRHGRGLHDLAAALRRAEGRPGELSARHLGDGLPGRLDSAVRRVRRAAGLSRRRPLAGAVPDARRRLLRHRRLRGGRAVRQAPDGAGDQPEEVVGGLRRAR